jgi:hypothetical protein
VVAKHFGKVADNSRTALHEFPIEIAKRFRPGAASPRTPMGRLAIIKGTPQKDFIPLSSKTRANSGKRRSL